MYVSKFLKNTSCSFAIGWDLFFIYSFICDALVNLLLISAIRIYVYLCVHISVKNVVTLIVPYHFNLVCPYLSQTLLGIQIMQSPVLYQTHKFELRVVLVSLGEQFMTWLTRPYPGE